MYEMVEALAPLQQRIYSLINEYEDHPQLQKILDIIEMLLTIPSQTPLAKVLILVLSFNHVLRRGSVYCRDILILCLGLLCVCMCSATASLHACFCC